MSANFGDRPYRVINGRQIEVGGIVYAAGQVVFLSLEESTYHQASIEPAFDFPYEDSPPYFANWVARRKDDLEIRIYSERYLEPIKIAAITTGNPSTITCATPHYLTTGARVNVRIISDTLVYNEQLIATVTTATAFTVPMSLILPVDFEIAEVGVPNDLSASTWQGGIHAYLNTAETYTVVGQMSCQAGSPRTRLISSDPEEAQRIRVGDRVRVAGALEVPQACLGRSDVVARKDGLYESAYVFGTSATADLTTDQIFCERETVSDQIGAILRPFVFAGNLLFGEVIARVDFAQIDSLPLGLYPYKILRITGTAEEIFTMGTIEVLP